MIKLPKQWMYFAMEYLNAPALRNTLTGGQIVEGQKWTVFRKHKLNFFWQ